jgi:4-amino-4-deoxy-L-arabinose transferase-like glycosyltransferase
MRSIGFLLSSGLGIMVPAISILFWLKHGHAFNEFWDQVISYNRIYSGFASIRERLIQLIKGGFPLVFTGLFPLAFVGYFVALKNLFLNKRSDQGTLLLLFAVMDLPLEFIFINLPGRLAPHYFFTIIPITTILTSYALFEFLNLEKIWECARKYKFTALLIFLAFGITGPILFHREINRFCEWFLQKDAKKMTRLDVTQEIESHSSEKDPVLVWGGDAGLLFAANGHRLLDTSISILF